MGQEKVFPRPGTSLTASISVMRRIIMSELLTLQSQDGTLNVTVNPQEGGRLDLVRFLVAGEMVDIFLPGKSCKPMFPWVGRLPAKEVRMLSGYRTIRHIDERFIHGIVQYRPWEVLEADDRHVALSQHFNGDEDGFTYPSAFTSKATYEVISSPCTALRCTLEAENTGRVTMIAGGGIHMFGKKRPFRSGETPRLTIPARRMFEFDPQLKIPAAGICSIPPKYRFQSTPITAEMQIDHCYYGWHRDAIAEWPDAGFRFRVVDVDKSLEYAHLWLTDPDIFAIEPQNMVANAFSRKMSRNRAGGGGYLRPGGKFRLSIEFVFESLKPSMPV